MFFTKLKYLTLFLVIFIFLISACATQQTTDVAQKKETKPITTQPKANLNVPASIVTFASADEGNLIRFYFILQDSSGNRIPANGNVDFKILDELNNVLYSKSFDVSKSDYLDYQFQLTGQELGKAYEWKVPVEDIDYGYSEYGNAEMTFESDGKKLSSTAGFIDIPTLSDEEILAIYEKEYQKSKIDFEESITKGSFKVDVTGFGFYNLVSFGSMNEVFRVDIIAQNIGSERKYFSTSMSILDSEGNQYDSAYGGTLEFKNMFPNTKQEGYVIFEDFPRDINSAKLVFELGYDSGYNEYIFEYDLPKVS